MVTTLDKTQLEDAIIDDKKIIAKCAEKISTAYELMNHTRKEMEKKYTALTGV